MMAVEVAELSVAMVPVHVLKQNPYQLCKADPSLWYQQVCDLSTG